MEWMQEFSVQVPEIDKDHQILVDCVTEIEQAVSKTERQHAEIAKLTYLSRTHFTAEETLMRAMGYDRLEAHIQEHKKFLTDLEALEEESLTAGLSMESAAKLRVWLEDHFVSADKEYAFLLSKEKKEFVKKYYS